jgi:hypothetical protein
MGVGGSWQYSPERNKLRYCAQRAKVAAVFSKKEQKILDRLKASGYPINTVQLNAPLKFIVRPFTTVGIESTNLASWFEDEIFSSIKDFKFGSPITGIAIFPTIFDRQICDPPKDHLRYKKNEKSVFVGLNIEFSSWTSAPKREKLRLLSDNITRSIERIPNKYLANLDREKLLSIASQVYDRLTHRLLH